MESHTLISYAKNSEDVVLWRALGGSGPGCYVDVGAGHPRLHSVTRAFYEHGWRGIDVEPAPEFAALLRENRPQDVVVEALAGHRDEPGRWFHVIDGTGLSTTVGSVALRPEASGNRAGEVTVPVMRLPTIIRAAGWTGREVRFLRIDVEGAEPEVLAGTDLASWRPCVIVVRSVARHGMTQAHRVWEPLLLEADYLPRLFDGVNRFYVAVERAESVGDALDYPACSLDAFDRISRLDDADRQAKLSQELLGWRARALEGWVASLPKSFQEAQQHTAQLQHEVDVLHGEQAALQRQLTAIQQTVSWRVTSPLREIRRRQLKGRAQ